MYVEPFCTRHFALSEQDQVHLLAFYFVWDCLLMLVVFLVISAYYSVSSNRDPDLLSLDESNNDRNENNTKENDVLLSKTSNIF